MELVLDCDLIEDRPSYVRAAVVLDCKDIRYLWTQLTMQRG
jgi:hypothetical protein